MARLKGDELRRGLRSLIDGAVPGDRLPPERDLIGSFGVARETLRRALDDFIAEGRLERRPGVGTFVTRPKITKQFRMQSFTEDMQARGMTSSSQIISVSESIAGARTGAALQISPGAAILSIRRLRLADGEPMALESLRLPAELVPGLQVDELKDHSLYAILRTNYGIELHNGSQTIEATVTDVEQARLLRVAPLSPALLVDRVTWTTEGRRIESVRSVYRGDRYRFEVDLTEGPALTPIT